MTQEEERNISLSNGLRATGRSTRLIDEYVQELFKNGWVQVYDHHPDYKAHDWLLDRMMKRLRSEHPRNVVLVDKKTRIIKLA